ncbi:zinc transporter ZIP3 [Esox lucius]|uniref:Zinc transporter ZIP3 n=1 Tax=Esox lucius TaxID=8010 RepID=A0A3P8ZGP3_ESOLU|nr:zinc transporter ZIP3 [Esox lucius]XP_010869646.1 zinc transporter ZIP3 [Esox lucius]XP_019904285.1 zinc transporter ZIP3 [Esox lucius]XP_034149848.1 zinc transporter ZIP3 [Esox lucius]
MELALAKVLCLLGVFALMLAGILVPVRLMMQVDYEKAQMYRKPLALCNSFGGGVFLATCFNALLPAVRNKVDEVLKLVQINTDYPLAETIMMLGFFLTVFVEQTVLTFKKEKPSFIDLETFNAGGSEAGSDSEYDTPFISPTGGSPVVRQNHHGHHHGHLSPAELARAGPLRLASLVLALSAHSVFEGLALGLQEDGARLGSLFLGVGVHETLAAVALGVSVAKAAMPMRDAAKLGVTVSLMVPIGIGLGMGINTAQNLAGGVTSAVLQGLAAGTFLFVTFFEILSRELEDKHDRLLKVFFLVLGYGVLAGLMFIKW